MILFSAPCPFGKSHANDIDKLPSHFFDEVCGATIIFQEIENTKSEVYLNPNETYHNLSEYIERVVQEIRHHLNCKDILVVEYLTYKNSEKSFQFFSAEDYSSLSSVGYILKGTFSEQSGFVEDQSYVTSNKELVESFDDPKEKIHYFQMGFSSNLVSEEKLARSEEKSKFRLAILASVIVAATIMRLGEKP